MSQNRIAWRRSPKTTAQATPIVPLARARRMALPLRGDDCGLAYLSMWSLSLNVPILLRTPGAVLSRQGAY
ncbi:MAG TPA: hypothetical protein VMT46_05710 [Anaerolineaceae bacterium]|nr:hypothetical protein [Anaerolineaceae bacterium]